MDKITPQDVWIAVDVNERLPPSVPVPFTDSHSTHWLENKSNMIVLTPEQLEEIIKNNWAEKLCNQLKAIYDEFSDDWDAATQNKVGDLIYDFQVRNIP